MFVALAASVFSLLAIAIERHLTMLKMKLHNNGNTFRVFLLISTVWMIAAMLGGLPIMGWNCIESMANCSTPQTRLPKSHKRRERQHKHQQQKLGKIHGSSENRHHRFEWFHRVLGSAFHPAPARRGLRDANVPDPVQGRVVFSASRANSAMNPLIYTLTSNEMRRAFLKTLLCCTAWIRPKFPSGPIAEFSRSKSDNSSHPNKEDGEYSPKEPRPPTSRPLLKQKVLARDLNRL
ncbi:hypothetical protein WMY93_024235 [Mugilogobius chulae]|uniref:G-protein coupled receptors family 1 profile domain-containing protein n=1 Tax=Mugilogobius chulae TaxID=88201 RepID=A0AAW0N3Y3_9GOBI